jgi:spermidine synthase
MSGTATMCLQMAAVRALSPWVGASAVVWAAIISLSLLAMSCGYAWGGRKADQVTGSRTLTRSLGGAALFTGLSPLIVRSVMPHADLGISSASTAIVVASAVGHLSAFFVPALLLGMTLPLVTRLAMQDVSGSGATAGRVYGVSTLGSIAGTLVSSLVLLQWLGTRWTLWGTAAALVVASALASRLTASVTSTTKEDDVVQQPVLSFRLACLVVVVEGMATMATEMTAARLLAPFFGTSQVVWAMVIAVTMACIAAGAWSGGRVADRRPEPATLGALLFASAAAVALLPFVSRPIMQMSTGGLEDVDVALLAGTFTTALALIAVPVFLLGMIPPTLVRLRVSDVGHAGNVAGRLYALSTAGALMGTLTSALWLVPTLGTRRTFLILALLLCVVAFIVVRRGALRIALPVGLAVATAAPVGVVKPLAEVDVLREEESDFQFIQVTEDAVGTRRLRLNEGWAVHSVYRPDTVLTNQYWDDFLLLPALSGGAPKSFLVVGNAGGTTARAFREYFPEITVQGVEIDAAVTSAGRHFFDMGDMAVVAQDGRPFLSRSKQQWDLLQVDAYRQPYIPFYVATREFFRIAKDRLTTAGVLAINVGTTPDDHSVSEAIAATMRAEFPMVLRYRSEDYNDILLGFNDPDATLASVVDRLGRYAGPVPDLARDFVDRVEVVPAHSGRVLTDDRAPIEWMTNGMIFSEAENGG